MFSSVGTHAAINSSENNYKIGAAALGLLGVAAIFVAAFAPISLLCAGICFGAGVLCLLGALWLLQKADAAGSSDETDEAELRKYTPPDLSDNKSLPRSDFSDSFVEDNTSISSEDAFCHRGPQPHDLFDEDANEYYSGRKSREASSSHLPGDHQEQAKLKHAIRELARSQKLTDYASSGLYLQYARDVLHRKSDFSLEQEPVMQWLKQLADANQLATDKHVGILWGCFKNHPELATSFAKRIKIFQGECDWSKPQLEKLSELCGKYELTELKDHIDELIGDVDGVIQAFNEEFNRVNLLDGSLCGIYRDFWTDVFLSPDINNKDALDLLARYITDGVFNDPNTYLGAVPSYIYITPALARVDWQHDTVQTFFSETVCQPDFLKWLFEADSDHEYFLAVMQWALPAQIETLLHALEQMPDCAIKKNSLLDKVKDLLTVAEETCAAESLE